MNLAVNLMLSVVALACCVGLSLAGAVALRKQVRWPDVLLAVLTFGMTQVYLYGFLQPMVAGSLSGAGTFGQALGGGAVSAATTWLAFFALFGLIYRGQASSRLAASVGLGGVVFDLLFAVGYNALNYALVFGALRSGDASAVFGDSFTAEQVVAMSEGFMGLSPAVLLALVLQCGVSLVAVGGACLLFFRGYDESAPVNLGLAFAWLLVGRLVAAAGAVGAMAGLVVASTYVALGLWYLLAAKNSVLRPYVQQVAEG